MWAAFRANMLKDTCAIGSISRTNQIFASEYRCFTIIDVSSGASAALQNVVFQPPFQLGVAQASNFAAT
jgi:hypothetical protein